MSVRPSFKMCFTKLWMMLLERNMVSQESWIVLNCYIFWKNVPSPTKQINKQTKSETQTKKTPKTNQQKTSSFQNPTLPVTPHLHSPCPLPAVLASRQPNALLPGRSPKTPEAKSSSLYLSVLGHRLLAVLFITFLNDSIHTRCFSDHCSWQNIPNLHQSPNRNS